MKKNGKRSRILNVHVLSLLIGFAVFLAIGVLSQEKGFIFKQMELGLLDQYFRYKAVDRTDSSMQEGVTFTAKDENLRVSKNISIIAIDNDALDYLGRWPWPRSVQSRVIQSASRVSHDEYRERALLMDIFYFDPSTQDEDAVLLQSIRENDRIFLENILDWNLSTDPEERAYTYAVQDLLYNKYGTVQQVSGDWRKAETFMNDNLPWAPFADATKGYGHANYVQDTDQIYRNARLVARASRLMEEYDVPMAGPELKNRLAAIKINPSNFEWLAWKDKEKNEFHLVDTDALAAGGGTEALEKELIKRAVPVDSSEAGSQMTRLRKFKDFFVPSIVLSLALEYYHKKMSDVEIRYGEYIRIPDPEQYDLDMTDVEHPVGTWNKLTRNGALVPEIRIPIDEQGMMRINFMGASSETSHTFEVLSFARFADPDRIPAPDAPPEQRNLWVGLQNKVAIVCAYSSGMASDEKTTPFGLMYGGEIHANALNTILMDNYIIEPPLWITLAIIFFAVMLTAVVTSRCSPLLSLVITFWHVVVYFFVVIQLFDVRNILLNFSGPLFGMFFTYLIIVAYRVIFEEQDKRRIKGMFAKYVNPQVVEQLLVNPPELGGVDKEITVLFSDIRGFTSLSETMTPQSLVNHLNLYLTEMTNILIDYHGTLDKYVGDMVMGFWGAPLPQKNHALLACKCALKQMEVLRNLNQGWPPEKRIEIGIGINSGIMTVGNMGSPARMNYTLMGDNVNLGSRLEGTNKSYHTNIIISEYTYGLVKDQVVVRELDNIRVKGKNKPVLIYELIDVTGGLEPPKASEVY